MKKRTLIILMLCGVIASQSIFAQTPQDLLRFSNYDYSFGTARSSAMGGAFSSLGADASSMVINPAGLGMYRSSEITISPSLTINNAKVINDDYYGTLKSSANKTKLMLNNLAGVFNIYNGAGGLTSVTLGFGYTKLSDFNSSTSVRGASRSSMIDAFGSQMARSGIIPPSNGAPINFTSTNSPYWGGVMAYNTMLLSYDADGYFADNMFSPIDTVLNSRFIKNTKGYTGQYDLSAGVNISNFLYLGFGFGIQDITYTEIADYRETPLDQQKTYGLNNFRYVQGLRMDGSAWNFKFGAILRPIESLRISAAIHTPTYVSMDEGYYSDMYAYFNDFAAQKDGVETGNPISYNFRTPARAVFGLSFVDRAFGAISVDYERVWYNKMKSFEGDGWGFEDMALNDEITEIYKPANNIRIGAEVVLDPNLFLRLGYAIYGSMYDNDNLEKYGKRENYSAGLGYRTARFGLDLAYVLMNSKQTPARVYDEGDFKSGLYTVKDSRHNITLTASFRF